MEYIKDLTEEEFKVILDDPEKLEELIQHEFALELAKLFKADRERLTNEFLYGTGKGKPVGLLNAD